MFVSYCIVPMSRVPCPVSMYVLLRFLNSFDASVSREGKTFKGKVVEPYEKVYVEGKSCLELRILLMSLTMNLL